MTQLKYTKMNAVLIILAMCFILFIVIIGRAKEYKRNEAVIFTLQHLKEKKNKAIEEMSRVSNKQPYIELIDKLDVQIKFYEEI